MKGNADCHCSNAKYRDNYGSIFGRKETDKELEKDKKDDDTAKRTVQADR